MKVYACYVMLSDGTCIHASTFFPMPESALITAMISAMQAFIKEVSGNYAKKVSTGGFVFHLDRVGKVVFILACDDDNRPDTEMNQMRIRFLHKYGASLDNFKGMTDDYLGFEKDIKEIFDIKEMERKIEPQKQLNSFALLQIPKHLQEVARQVIMKKEISAKSLAETLEITNFPAKEYLEDLFSDGFLGRYFNGFDYLYFI